MAADAHAAAEHGAALGSRRISARMVTDLPEPDSPMMHSTSPGAMLEADAVDRLHRRLAADELHGEVVHLDERPRRTWSDFRSVPRWRAARPSRASVRLTTADRAAGWLPRRLPARLCPRTDPPCGRRRDATRGRPRCRAPAPCAAHTASANGQRVRKRQPDGGSIGLGGSPVIGASSTRSSGSMDEPRAEQRLRVGMLRRGRRSRRPARSRPPGRDTSPARGRRCSARRSGRG